ncbi:Zinc finger, C2H2 type [Popillia japonica]|uniref:Zinc finger, C2H2 type n=1 Tax=Popillia japonica TaxID=7064 RepID=A0AAW1MZU3_POPJA
MFCDISPKDSHSESSSSSPNTMATSHKESNSLTSVSDSVSIKLNRSATVRRVIPIAKKEEMTTADDFVVPVAISSAEKYRRSIDSTYRHSLESISEYKTKRSFSTGLYPSREASSLDSAASDCTDYARRHSSDTYNAKDLDKSFISPSASYLSWIESVNSEYFGNPLANNDVVDIDNKVGEWNNFWLNYNSPHNRYLSSHHNKLSNEERTADDLSDCKSTCSTHRDFTEKISSDQVVLTYDEITEVMQCAQKITDVLQKAMKRNDEIDQSRNDSYYSQHSNSYSDEIPKERSYSFMDPQELQKQKQLLKPPTSSSCINVLLATGVADILKRVINKRREVIAPEETVSNTPRMFSKQNSVKMAATEQFSLRWNNFHSNLTSGFHDLLEAADMVDVTLAIDGHFLQAHKLVLSICSPYFKQLFKINPCKHPIVILKDVSHGNMKDILEFMYMGEVNVLRENLPSFLRTAELLQVKGLTGDDSSDASSKKDDKAEGFCDNDEDLEYNQYPESDSSVLPSYATSLPSSQQQKSTIGNNVKRSTKNSLTNNNSKRIKSETNSPLINKVNSKVSDAGENTPTNEDDSEFIEVPTKLDQSYDKDDSAVKKENFSFDSNISPNALVGDVNSQDHGKTETKYKTHLFRCEKCTKGFSRRDHLRTHEKNIHGEDAGPFACIICSQLYKNSESLRKHIAKFHYQKVHDMQQKVPVNG